MVSIFYQKNVWNFNEKKITYQREKQTKLFNPLEVIRWNSNKLYLQELSNASFSTIETFWLNASELRDKLPNIISEKKWDKCIIKPIVGGNSGHASLWKRETDNLEEILSICKESGKEMWMIQPFITEILTEGEISFIFIGNQFSHAIKKIPKQDDFRTQISWGASCTAYLPSVCPCFSFQITSTSSSFFFSF